MKSIAITSLSVFALAVGACGTDEPVDDTPRRMFIQRVNAALHPSSPPLAEERVEELLALKDEQIVAELYADPATREAVFKVGLAFLGAPVDQLRSDGGWAEAPFAFAPAVSAAHAFATGGDPLPHLFTTKAVIPTGPPSSVRIEFLRQFLPDIEIAGSTRTEKRASVAKLVADDLVRLRAIVNGSPEPFDPQLACNEFFNSPFSFLRRDLANILGAPAGIVAAGYPSEMDDPAFLALEELCFQFPPPPSTKATVLARLDVMSQKYTAFFTRMEGLFAMWEGDGAFGPFDLAAIGFTSFNGGPFPGEPPPGMEQPTPYFYPRFWQLALNSSTNYDRRRGAYALDRFFCDDLKPVGAALPEVHGGDRHATEPACAACHFKLDPMAGFFRRHGFGGFEFTDTILEQNFGFIQFDDGAQMPFTEFEANWRAVPGAGREFEVGYIRSTRDPSLNSYGNTLADLDGILATAPEVERCFVKRVFEHFNGLDQAVDPGFLDEVVAEMRTAGAARLQTAMTRILAGNTFKEPKRNSNVCYDRAKGAGSGNQPPCEVASTLRNNCTRCHGATDPQGGLDLTSWAKADDGGFGFRSSANVSRKEVFERILDRIATSDLTRQMPQGGDMPLRAREDLALWLRTMIDEAAAP